jgi:hypothetical protein
MVVLPKTLPQRTCKMQRFMGYFGAPTATYGGRQLVDFIRWRIGNQFDNGGD